MANARTIECLIVPVNPQAQNNSQRQISGTGDVSVLQIQSAEGGVRESLIFRKGQKITMILGDKIKCVSGKVLLFFHPNPGSSRMHTLSAQPNGEKEKTEVEVNEETSKQTTVQAKLALTGVNHRVMTGIVVGREGVTNSGYHADVNGSLHRL